MENAVDPARKYEKAKADRSKYVEDILKSKSRKKVVVAGPGTGKTFLFKEILRDKNRCLTLTFVNSLVEDLSLELNGLSEVRTLHSFARSLLSGLIGKNITIVPSLPDVIREDAKILVNEDVDFNRLFHERDDENAFIEFYGKRKCYYGDCYGYSDVIFDTVQFLETNPDKVPVYDQVVVDEFQDFNRLEVSLIDLLAEKSPVLLVGDDDQALYDFKSASSEHIRKRHDYEAEGYERFCLPFCSRSTRVIVGAANDIIEAAVKGGFLQGRIAKPYVYFDDEAKDKVSDRYPTISYGHLFAAQIPWFIRDQISKIALDLKSTFTVLIISPTKIQSRGLVTTLRDKGFEKIEYDEKRWAREPSLLDGLKILLADAKSNLGWRIVGKCLLEKKDFDSVLKETAKEKAKHVHELIGSECKLQVKELRAVLQQLKDDKPIDEDGIKAIKKLGLDPYKRMRDSLAEEFDLESQGFAEAAVRKIPIRATTIESSKGLSADYVFITHFDDQYLIKQSLTDKVICNFLVALTRARNKVFLISSKQTEPTFLKWIKKERIKSP